MSDQLRISCLTAPGADWTICFLWPSNVLANDHRSPVDSPHKRQWRGALMFFFSCAWTNTWVNNRDAGDTRRHCAHYSVTVMACHQVELRERMRLIVNWAIWSKYQSNFNQIKVNITKMFSNAVDKMSIILSRPQPSQMIKPTYL